MGGKAAYDIHSHDPAKPQAVLLQPSVAQAPAGQPTQPEEGADGMADGGEEEERGAGRGVDDLQAREDPLLARGELSPPPPQSQHVPESNQCGWGARYEALKRVATMTLLLGLVLQHGRNLDHLQPPSATAVAAAQGSSIDALLEKLKRRAGHQAGALRLDALSDWRWAGAPDEAAVRQQLAALDASLGSTALGEGSFNHVYAVPGRPDLVLRVPKDQPTTSLRAAINRQAPSLLRHMRAADLPLRPGDAACENTLGVRVVGLVPIINDRTPPKLLTKREGLDDLFDGGGAGWRVVIGMVLERVTPMDEAIRELAKSRGAAGMWRGAVLLACASGVFALAARLNEAELFHPDLKSNNLGFTGGALQALGAGMLPATLRPAGGGVPPSLQSHGAKLQAAAAVTALDNDGLRTLSARTRYHETLHTARWWLEKSAMGHARYCPRPKMQPEEEVGFKAALVVGLMPEAMLDGGVGDCVVPRVWHFESRGVVAVLIFSRLIAAELVQVLAALVHPVASCRRLLQELQELARWLAVYTAARTISRGPATLPADDTDWLARLRSPAPPQVLEALLNPGLLDSWLAAPLEEELLGRVFELLYEAAHNTWPAGRTNTLLQQLLMVAALCDVARSKSGMSKKLLLIETRHAYYGRSLLHLLMATGNTEAVHTLLWSLCGAGADEGCVWLIEALDQNNDTAAALAAVLWQLESVTALVDFVEARMQWERQEEADGKWLSWLDGNPTELGSLLTIICSRFNGRNAELSRRLALAPPLLWLPAACERAAGSGSEARAGAAGGGERRCSSPKELLSAILKKRLDGPLAVTDVGALSAAVSPERCPSAASLLLLLRGLPQVPPADPMAPQHELHAAAAATPAAPEQPHQLTSYELGGNTALHAAAAMASDLPALHASITQLLGADFARQCMEARNRDGHTPVEVLLRCHFLVMSGPGFADMTMSTEGRHADTIMSDPDSQRRPPGRVWHVDTHELKAVAGSLRQFVSGLPEELRCGDQQLEIDEVVGSLLATS
ncbi:hypothetical protein HXX76_009233 [Chlamydomonas incerta]|uniref:Uncharacterized protein n=1 Tax=Chlamydomonas incerta TaxID=51695 RepID=A0A835SR14_CHLIN|nr:hypothetical protein HXX76_009233 [Chlamydomonas incerta]|eukprot:KAG2431737.1 hypothetical protein HXX76_009233 [Chlamydomonas incerta]